VDDPVLFNNSIASRNHFFHGTAKFSAPAGHYRTMGQFSPIFALG